MAEPGVGPLNQEEVGEAGHGRPEVGRRARAPDLRQAPALAPHDVLPERHLGRVEAGREHQHVGRPRDAIRPDRLPWADLDEGAVDDGRVGPGERGVVVVGEQDPLAPDPVARRQDPAQGGVGDLGFQVAPRHHPLGLARDPGVAEGEPVGLVVAEQRPLERLLERGLVLEPLARPVADRRVAARDHPGRRPLVQRQGAGQLLERRDELDGRGTGPHDGHVAAFDLDGVVPARRVHDVARERVEAGDVGQAGLGERAGRRDQHVGRPIAPVGLDPPARRVVVPGRLAHVVAEPDVRRDAEPVGDVAEVVLDLGLGREPAAPVGVGRERERVQVRLDVARRARVGVVPPHAADLVGPLEHDQALDALLEQPDGRPDPPEPGSDDGSVDVGDGRHGAASAGGRR